MSERNYDIYWSDQRRKGQAFENAAEEAKREMFPELFFLDHEPNRAICRVCKNEGFHSEECKLRHPDNKDVARVEDLVAIAPDAPKAEKSVIELERERLQRIKDTPELPAPSSI